MNAIAYNDTVGFVDCFGGVDDIKNKIIRAVGDPDKRFEEDALRIMRCIRFASVLGFDIEKHTSRAVHDNKDLLKNIAVERIYVELVKLLMGKNCEQVLLEYKDVIGVIIPELVPTFDCRQVSKWHIYDVYTHIAKSVAVAPKKDHIRLALLFHDIAKPVCKTTDETGVDHFYGHPKEGAKMAHRIFRRLKFDVDTMQKVCGLVEWHDDNPNLTPAGIRKAIYRVGEERYPDLFALKRADVLSQSGYRREEKLAYIQSYQKLYEEIIEQKDCLSLKKLAVNGRDLMELGIKPGKKIGQILQKLLEEVLEEPDKNKKEYLLERVKQTYQ